MTLRVLLLFFGWSVTLSAAFLAAHVSFFTWIWFFVAGILLALFSGQPEWPPPMPGEEPPPPAMPTPAESAKETGP